MTVDVDPPEAVRFRLRMVERLVELEYVPAGWEDTLLEVPRHVFAPELVWHPTSKGYLPLCRGDDPMSWLGMVHRDDYPIVAQVDDGAPQGMGKDATCTVLAVSDVTWLLGLVPVTPGMRVCVVGAGLGYLTALLAHRLGADAVSAVEINPALADDCRRRLDAVGLGEVDVLTADATVELPDGPPFDLVLSTVTLRQVPGTWLDRARPGGMIVTGFGTGYTDDHIIQLRVHQGQRATGRIVGEIETDWERGQRPPRALTVAEVKVSASGTADTTFDVAHPPRTRDIVFATGVRVPGCVRISLAYDDDLWFIDPATGSRAHWHRSLFGRYRVDQYGPRRLWDEIHQAHRWWNTHGRPTPGDWLITATSDGTTVELPELATAAIG